MARKILLADDSVTAQNMGRKILADAGYEVITVNNGSAALKKIGELKPDLVILDVYMPGYSGLEVCQRLKESHDSSRIPVLLTVGKLEPFKPEEAQRVRAEGFIVKPFEASELLSALSKLEDKVVPRAEPSKPGRFARAMASVEESGRGGASEPADDDSGWKTRIGFPHHKAESQPQAEEKFADDASIYNAMNTDLRTVVETTAEKKAEKDHKRQEKKRRQTEPAAEFSVDVAAVTPPGLPHDVTAEEVAAIAAAAAQIKTLEAAISEDADQQHGAPAELHAQVEANVAAASPSLVRAEATLHRPIEDEPSQPVSENASQASQAQDQQKDQQQDKEQDKEQDQPVTMAAATAETPVNASGASRWTAVSVALQAEESNISLDQEMQKAYSAFVAEETAAAEVKTAPQPAQPAYSSAPPPTVVEEIPPISNPKPQPEPEPAIMSQAPEAEPVPSAPPPAASAEPARVSIPPEAAFSTPVAAEVAPPESHAEPVPPQFSESIPVPAAESASQIVEPAAEPVAPSHPFASFVSAPEHKQEASHEVQHDEVQHKEDSETVKTTAAAWASWRQIRDTGDANPAAPDAGHQQAELPEPVPAEPAAMAAAAGAEKISQETPLPSAENPTDVSSIVDSVLADLRPRLMAEISRKMAKKK